MITTPNGIDQKAPIEEVNRLLEIGKMLFSVLTAEEIEELQAVITTKSKLGNAGDS